MKRIYKKKGMVVQHICDWKKVNIKLLPINIMAQWEVQRSFQQRV